MKLQMPSTAPESQSPQRLSLLPADDKLPKAKSGSFPRGWSDARLAGGLGLGGHRPIRPVHMAVTVLGPSPRLTLTSVPPTPPRGVSCACRLSRFRRVSLRPVDCSPPGSPVPGLLQAGTREWAAISSSRGPSRPRDRTRVSCVVWRWQEGSALLAPCLTSVSFPGALSKRVHLWGWQERCVQLTFRGADLGGGEPGCPFSICCLPAGPTPQTVSAHLPPAALVWTLGLWPPGTPDENGVGTGVEMGQAVRVPSVSSLK